MPWLTQNKQPPVLSSEPEPDQNWNRVNEILQKNKDKNFVQRILKPDVNPVLDEYAGPGTHGTHLMSWATVGDKHIVYPEIIQTPKGDLKRLGRTEARVYAIKNKEYIEFDTPEEADWFGKNYKRVWGRH